MKNKHRKTLSAIAKNNAFQGWLGGIYGKDGECSQEMPIWSTVKPKIDKLTKHKPTKEGI